MALVERFFTIAEQLFARGEVSLSEHFARIEALLLAQADEADLLAQERELLRGLRERIADEASQDERFLPQDLAEAITLYLGGDLTDPEFEPEDSEDELIKSFVGLDGAPLGRGGRHLHLCLLSEKSLPKRKRAFPWPLSQRTFAHMANHIAIRLLTLREEESKRADRYLFFTAVTWAERVTLSWTVRWQDEELGPSPYLMLLEPYCRVAAPGLQRWSAGDRARADVASGTVPADPEAYERLPIDALAEYALCPRRFFYSFLAQESPSYPSDFQHQFLYGSLARVLAETTGEPVDVVAGELGKLFPQWTALQRRGILERAPGISPHSFGRYDGVHYPPSRLRVELLHLSEQESHGPALEVLRDPARQDRVRADLASALTSREAMLPANPSHACRFCPHTEYCDAAKRAIDDREEGADAAGH